MAIEKFVSTKNIETVIKPEQTKLDVDVHVDLGMAAAHEDSIRAAQNVDDVVTELEEKAEPVILEEPESPEVKEQNIYTKKLTLSEDIDDASVVKSKKVAASDEDDDYDDYLDYDMFDFVYGIVAAESWPVIKNPLGRPMRKFLYTGSDDYMNTNENKGIPQVSTDIKGNVVVYSDAAADFNDVMQVCDHYGIKHSAPSASRSDSNRWKFSLTVYVPMTSEGYPELAEDFLAKQGLTLSDVIADHNVGKGKTANWGKTHADKLQRDFKAAEKKLNDDRVKEIYDSYVVKAANSTDPLEGFIKDMFAEMKSKGLTFAKGTLKKEFLAEFEDDFEDEE